MRKLTILDKIWADIYEKWLNFKIKDSELPDIDEQEMFANIMEAIKKYENNGKGVDD